MTTVQQHAIARMADFRERIARVGVVSRIETQADFERVSADVAAARDIRDEVERVFHEEFGLKQAKHVVKQLTAKLTETVAPLKRFEADADAQMRGWAFRQREARAAQIEAERRQTAAALAEAGVEDVADVAHALVPSHAPRVASAAGAMVTRKQVNVVNVSEFVAWLNATHPEEMNDVAEMLGPVARRLSKQARAVAPGCEEQDVDSFRRR